MANYVAGCQWHSSCKSPRTLQKCNLLITRQLTFGAVLGEHKLSLPSTRLKVNHLCIRCLCFESVRGDLQEGHFYDSPCYLPIFPSTKSRFLCASYWGCWPGCGNSGLWESNTERWELKSRIGKRRVTVWGDRMCCGKQNSGSHR